MIKVNNLDKYFNKNKENSIHVIDNVNLEFPKSGLISLVGQSGSGKTTLLNVISGLDKANGTIQFDNVLMNKYESHTWDKLRANDIGYVFQNYYLLEDRSVYDNIAITLNMIGIVDKEEVDYRVNYCLDAVGMFRYRKKLASDLSGGQKQRVAIARAIAKNPKVVIADEPTGNLDSLNSIEVMKIIKKISEERLVVLVTHNINLANKYSDRIINISDGKVISDNLNTLSGETELIFDDNNIYLGNLENMMDQDGIKVYTNDLEQKLNLMIIKINNNYFLKPMDDNIRINVITPNSGIEIIDDKKENYDKSNDFKTEFSLDQLDKVKTLRKKKKTFTVKESVIEAFRKITNLGRKSKIQIIALILLGIMFSVSVHTLFSNMFVDTRTIYTDKHVYVTDLDNPSNTNPSNFIEYIDLVNLVGRRSIELKIDKPNNGYFDLSLSLESALPIEGIKEEDITAGRLPINPQEIIIDSSILDKKYANSVVYRALGLNKVNDLLNQEVIIEGFNYFKIVGVVNTGSKGIYLDKMIANSYYASDEGLTYGLVRDDVEILSGTLEDSSDVVYALISDRYSSLDIYFKSNNIQVTGIFKANDNDPQIVMHQNSLNLLKDKHNIEDNKIRRFYSIDGTNPNDAVFENLYDIQVKNISEVSKESMQASVVQMIISLGLSSLIFYFLVRSSLTKRVKEISILRSLGVNKKEVISLFGIEYLVLTLFTSLIGVIIGTYLINVIANSFFNSFVSMRATPLSTLTSILGIISINVILALIPVFLLLRKTPANMLTNYDI
ncbi:ABC transporter ATP-binding protein/permease [Haploplasma modicum]|uniref:ABC transporter ATP-binding protein/permease n=1 Tax=Haploplasma modicum TaxID=2150 RepID=UPI000690EAD2|nr:ABC transporter ATP-binding protein/permease [Haploplasma modicum]